MDEAYDSIVGERGNKLSGGQKQRLSIARAVYKNPKILILDEATSAMDKKTEDFVFDLLLKLKNTIAVFYISHRFHTLKKLSDKIFVLKNNRIHSQGTHQELMQHDNLYSEYWSGLYES